MTVCQASLKGSGAKCQQTHLVRNVTKWSVKVYTVAQINCNALGDMKIQDFPGHQLVGAARQIRDINLCRVACHLSMSEPKQRPCRIIAALRQSSASVAGRLLGNIRCSATPASGRCVWSCVGAGRAQHVNKALPVGYSDAELDLKVGGRHKRARARPCQVRQVEWFAQGV